MAGRLRADRVARVQAPKPGATHFVRLAVPKDVREIVAALPPDDPRRAPFVRPDGKVRSILKYSTARRDAVEAEGIGTAKRAEWVRAIEALRSAPDPDDLASVLDRIDTWRDDAVLAAQGFQWEAALLDTPARRRKAAPAPGIDHGAALWARRYFEARPDASREAQIPPDTFMLLDRLSKAARGGEDWRDIEGFDDAMTEAVWEGAGDAVERPRTGSRGDRAALAPKVRGAARPAFAKAWGEVVRAREVERRFAATIVALVDGPKIEMPDGQGTYRPRPGDRTVGELLDAYLADYARKHDSTKDTVAPTRALREFLGEKTPVRAVRRDDARRFADFVETIPRSAGKVYPGVPLAEAAERAVKDGKPRISSVTAARYMTYASMIWNWGRREREGWADENPFEGQARPKKASVKREGFTNEELAALFAALRPYKSDGRALFWVPALGLNGARIGELLQLRPGDVKFEGDTPYLDLSPFAEDGRRDDAKRLKTDASERLAPIHPLAIKAGFLEFVERRRAEGAERLFPEIQPRGAKGSKQDWGHYYSKRINAILDKAVSDAPRLVAGHGFRHTLRERALDHDVPEEIVDAIGGWAQKTVGRKYGRKRIKLLSDHLANFDFGPLQL